MINYLSIDLESWAYPNLPEYISLTSEKRKRLDNGHVRDSTKLILNLLTKHKKKITFFVVGQLYEWYPEVIEMIEKQGHEIAFHTYAHNLLHTDRILEDDMKKAAKFLRRFRPVGFRAPRVSAKKEYLKMLKKYHFQYDSSFYDSFDHMGKVHGITEIPVSRWGGMPIGSGYFLGLMGKRIGWFYKMLNSHGHPFVGIVHNWQILSPVQPMFPTRTYLLQNPHYFPYLRNTAKDFEYILKEFNIAPMKKLVNNL